MSEAVGIHDHPGYALGRRPPKNAPAIQFADVWTGAAPAHPVTKDFIGGVVFGLDGNDKYGICGPTSCDNMSRALSAAALSGRSVAWTQAEVFALYKLNNPTFDPADPGGPGDAGVDMQTMLELWMAHGAGHDENGKPIKPIAFAKVNVGSDAELDAAVALGGLLWGISLQTAQQDQTNAHPPRWDYVPSSQWGGHAVYHGEYNEKTSIDDVVSWALDVQVTQTFRSKQLEEAWLVILPWHLAHPAFFNVVDVTALAAMFKALTGKDLPVQPPKPPQGPEKRTPADVKLWQQAATWAHQRHTGLTQRVSTQMIAWARAKGLEE